MCIGVRAHRPTRGADLHAIANWLAENGIQTIAMESTGVYWIPLFEVLEGRGIHGRLISGNLARRLPARHKTDVLDCQWIQTLHSLGVRYHLALPNRSAPTPT